MSIETHLAHAKRMKEGLVARQGVGTDIRPQLVMRKRHRTIGVLIMPEMERERLHACLGLAVALSSADEVIYFVEGYGVTGAGEVEGYVHGSLVERFAAGDPAVHECVLVAVVTAVSHAVAEQPYIYRGRTVEWKESTFPTGPVEGALADVLSAGFKARAERKVPAMTVTSIGLYLGVPAMGTES